MSDEVAMAIAGGAALLSVIMAGVSTHFANQSRLSTQRARVSENVCSNLADQQAAEAARANIRPAWPQG